VGPIASLDILEEKNLFLVLGFEYLVCPACRPATILLNYTGSVLLQEISDCRNELQYFSLTCNSVCSSNILTQA
jgi:hypothetical protein